MSRFLLQLNYVRVYLRFLKRELSLHRLSKKASEAHQERSVCPSSVLSGGRRQGPCHPLRARGGPSDRASPPSTATASEKRSPVSSSARILPRRRRHLCCPIVWLRARDRKEGDTLILEKTNCAWQPHGTPAETVATGDALAQRLPPGPTVSRDAAARQATGGESHPCVRRRGPHGSRLSPRGSWTGSAPARGRWTSPRGPRPGERRRPGPTSTWEAATWAGASRFPPCTRSGRSWGR